MTTPATGLDVHELRTTSGDTVRVFSSARNKPVSREWDLGVNAYGQPVRLVHGRGTGGEDVWTVHRDAADYRADRDQVAGLTRDQLRQIGEIANDPQN